MVRSRVLVLATVISALLLACSGGTVGIATAADGMPGEPAAFYGEAIEANGTEIPAGATIVAVVNGSVHGEITVEAPGSYGGSGAFDEKLRVDSTAGDEVTFHLVGPNGPVGGTTALNAGISEEDLTFPDGSIEDLPPIPVIEIEPRVATAGDSVVFSAKNSTVHDDATPVSFEWVVERDGETIETFDGETDTKSFSEVGVYDVALTVRDSNDRTATEMSELEIEADDEATSDGDDGGSSAGGGTSSGGSAGIGSTSDGDDPTSTESTNETESSRSTWERTRSEEPLLAETHRIEDQFPDAPGTAVVFAETMIKEIVFENESVNGEISIEEFDDPVNDSPPLPTDPFIRPVSAISVPAEYQSSDAVLRFVVSEEWVTERGFDPAYLTVYRLPDDGERWSALPTDVSVIDEGYAVDARTPGFSQFVVAGREPPTSEDEPTTASVESEGVGNRSDTTAGGSGSSEIKETADSTTTEMTIFDRTPSFVPLAFLGALLVVVAAVGRVVIPRRRGRW